MTTLAGSENQRRHPKAGTTPASTIDVSVVIPAYECSATIARALDSVFSQTFPAHEVIVVNDGSPDAPLLRRALEPYLGRIRYIQQENRGPSTARNAGIDIAVGKYVAFLDSDDFWFPHHLENQVRLLKSDPRPGLVFANPLLMDGDTAVGTAFDQSPPESPVTFESILREASRIGTSSTVASRAEILRAGGFDESMRRCEDFDLWLRMAFNGVRMAFSVQAQLCHHRRNGLSSNARLMKRARIAVYEKMARLLPLSPHQRSIAHQKISSEEASYQLVIAKESLLAKDYDQALASAQSANRVLNSWKLRVAMTGLRTSPAMLRRSYCAYERILEHRKRTRLGSELRPSMQS